MGSGYYIGASHSPEIRDMSEEEIAEGIVQDIMVGVGDTGVRAGIIGEIGCSIPLEEGERKVLRASAIAQRRTGAALSIHPSPRDDLALEIVNILGNAGADLTRTVISHVDAWAYSLNTCREIANAGCYLGYEAFGYEGIYIDFEGGTLEQLAHDDVQLVTQIMQLITEGYLSQILMSQDIYFKHQLVTYGGYGYAHILRDIVPVMQYKGMSDEQIHTLLEENPKRLLAFEPVRVDRGMG
jgi:phosphotriesterase-related protein